MSEPSFDWPKISEYRNTMTRNWNDHKQVADYEEKGVHVVKAAGKIAGPGRVEAGGETLETERILLATGSDPVIPPIDGLEESGYWTNRQATEFQEPPKSVVIAGGGPVGIELAQIFRGLGGEATVVEGNDHLLSRETPRISELVKELLEADGIGVHTGKHVESVRRDGDEKVVNLDDGAELRAQEFIVAVGRKPRAAELGLDSLGVKLGERGEVPIDEHCRVKGADNVWAVGDATGVQLFTHVGKYQARIVAADMQGKPTKTDYRAVPRVVFTHPEVAAVGLTEQQARDEGMDVAVGEIQLADNIARPSTFEEDPGGTLGVVIDRGRDVLVGAWRWRRSPASGSTRRCWRSGRRCRWPPCSTRSPSSRPTRRLPIRARGRPRMIGDASWDEIQDYTEQHTTTPPPYLRALYAETHETMSSPQMLSGAVEGRCSRRWCSCRARGGSSRSAPTRATRRSRWPRRSPPTAT